MEVVEHAGNKIEKQGKGKETHTTNNSGIYVFDAALLL